MNILFAVKEIDIEHLGIMQLSAILKQAGHHVEVVEATKKKVEKRILNNSFSIIAYSCPTLHFDYYLELNRHIKRKFEIFSLFGGAHATFSPEIICEDSIDCICRGEGESAIIELVEKISRKEDHYVIPNLWFKKNGNIIRNPVRPLIEDLDSLPYPDRELLPYSETHFKGKMHLISSRGCPYECTYCSHPAYNQLYQGRAKTVRRRSVLNVIKEIKQTLEKSPIKFIMFEDDLFISSYVWIKDFCDKYMKEVKLPFFCYVRPDLVTQEIIGDLKRAGCVSISMGLETADDYLRNKVLKRNMTKEEIARAARIIKKEKISLETTNIVGIPTGSLEADFETLKFNAALGVDYSSVKLLVPYPQTEIYKFANSNGLIDNKIPLSHWSSVLKFKIKKEKLATENLRKLFPIASRHPFLLPVIKRAIWLNTGRLFALINILWDGYSSYFILYPTGKKGFIMGAKKFMKIFFEYLA